MMSDVKIPHDMFVALVRYHLLDDASQEDYIKSVLQNKVDKLAARQEYEINLEKRKRNGV